MKNQPSSLLLNTTSQSPSVLYGITPPKLDNPVDKNRRITERRIERIQQNAPDGLVVYDIQDESDRTDQERPFPYLATIPAHRYASEDLSELELPKVVYLSVGNYQPTELQTLLANLPDGSAVVFVGSPATKTSNQTSLATAYTLYQPHRERLLLGGVVIAERHRSKRQEHLKLDRKANQGCRFFISQCVYNASMFKDMLSDYYYYCEQNQQRMQPVFMTLTPCGSAKTLNFIRWLGIEVPDWLANDLINNRDTLQYSIRQCIEIYRDVSDFCAGKAIPLGVNIESVAIRRDEVLASFELLNAIKGSA